MRRLFRCVTPALLAVWIFAGSAIGQTSARAYRIENEKEILAEFLAMLAIPNVASDTSGIRRNAEFITGALERRGLAPRLLKAASPSAPPLIYAEWKVPGATKTLVLYAHYDGQPTEP
jgi:acetylornithine deacetylase/succinyl-diaminopimelate desuccinylase-like protein